MKSLKDMVKGNKKVKFSFYREKELWYKTECGFEFPVPIDDVGGAIFMAEDKALLFMRYIRKHLKTIEQARVDQDTAEDLEYRRTAWDTYGSELAGDIATAKAPKSK